MPYALCIATRPEYAVGWFALSLINAGLAQSKNRSGFRWWLASVFVGPLATFLLVAFCERIAEPGKPDRDA